MTIMEFISFILAAISIAYIIVKVSTKNNNKKVKTDIDYRNIKSNVGEYCNMKKG